MQDKHKLTRKDLWQRWNIPRETAQSCVVLTCSTAHCTEHLCFIWSDHAGTHGWLMVVVVVVGLILKDQLCNAGLSHSQTSHFLSPPSNYCLVTTFRLRFYRDFVTNNNWPPSMYPGVSSLGSEADSWCHGLICYCYTFYGLIMITGWLPPIRNTASANPVLSVRYGS